MSKRYLKLIRISKTIWTVILSLICALSLAWWVRSYAYQDYVLVSPFPGQFIESNSASGRMCVWFQHRSGPVWLRVNSRVNDINTAAELEQRAPWFDVAFFGPRKTWPSMTRIYAAHWLLMLIAGSLAAAPWFGTRFKLRTLLFAVTLVAALAGAIAWVERTF